MLKPNEQITTSVALAAGIYAIFQLNAPNLADVKASAPGGGASVNTHGSVKTAVWTSALFTVGLGILAKDPVLYIVGGLVTSIEGWKYYHANALNTATGTFHAPGGGQSTLNGG